jgi:hypothetical protein
MNSFLFDLNLCSMNVIISQVHISLMIVFDI